jgi:hypothetical protein
MSTFSQLPWDGGTFTPLFQAYINDIGVMEVKANASDLWNPKRRECRCQAVHLGKLSIDKPYGKLT